MIGDGPIGPFVEIQAAPSLVHAARAMFVGGSGRKDTRSYERWAGIRRDEGREASRPLRRTHPIERSPEAVAGDRGERAAGIRRRVRCFDVSVVLWNVRRTSRSRHPIHA